MNAVIGKFKSTPEMEFTEWQIRRFAFLFDQYSSNINVLRTSGKEKETETMLHDKMGIHQLRELLVCISII
jgi:hypothetical protein